MGGRPHQIRIHMAFAGHPLVGDPLYECGGLPRTAKSDEARPPLPRDVGYLLHAEHLELEHPITRCCVHFCAPPPAALCLTGEMSFEEFESTLPNVIQRSY